LFICPKNTKKLKKTLPTSHKQKKIKNLRILQNFFFANPIFLRTLFFENSVFLQSLFIFYTIPVLYNPFFCGILQSLFFRSLFFRESCFFANSDSLQTLILCKFSDIANPYYCEPFIIANPFCNHFLFIGESCKIPFFDDGSCFFANPCWCFANLRLLRILIIANPNYCKLRILIIANSDYLRTLIIANPLLLRTLFAIIFFLLANPAKSHFSTEPVFLQIRPIIANPNYREPLLLRTLYYCEPFKLLRTLLDLCDPPQVAVHCVAGLGRAPCLVAIALVEQGMEALEAIQFVRQRRRGAINNKQLQVGCFVSILTRFGVDFCAFGGVWGRKMVGIGWEMAGKWGVWMCRRSRRSSL
jgi:hypothetical protein